MNKASVFLMRKPVMLVLRILLGVGLIAVWQGIVSGGVVDRFVLAAPRDVAKQLWDWLSKDQMWTIVEPTLVLLGVGLIAGIACGIALGTLMGVLPFARYYLSPFVAFFNSVPRLILIPFFIVWFGFGNEPGMIITALEIVFVVLLTVEAGVRQIQGDYVENARMLGASWSDLLRTVYLPGISIWALSATRVSVGLGFQAAVVVEFFGSPRGIGHLITEGGTTLNSVQLYAAIALTAILAYALDMLLRLVEVRVGRWNVAS
jgi:NitT/TauT family transport system permease protein